MTDRSQGISALDSFVTFTAFLRLGLTSFGGPIAHLGYFRAEFVARRRWLSEAAFADLVALCQFLPGPTSSQVGFAIGLKRAGAPGALAAWLGFTAPSAALMIAAAYGVSFFSAGAGVAIVHGLKIAAFAIVAQAVWSMARTLCVDWFTILLALGAVALLTVVSTAWLQPLVIVAAGGLGLFAPASSPADDQERAMPGRHGAAILALFVFAALLLALPLAARQWPALSPLSGYYRAGALVFGGGHVVLPLLHAETVETGEIGADAFLAGYGAAQAMPGPLFSFAAFLGAAGAPGGIGGGLLAMTLLFLPGLLLVSGALPYWDRIKHLPAARGFVRGASAAVVGVLGAALYNPIYQQAISDGADLAAGVAGLVALLALRAPPSVVVLGLAALALARLALRV